jgi:hypothetical protein
LLHHTPGADRLAGALDRQTSLLVLIATSLGAIAWSLVDPHHALWVFALNALAPLLARWRTSR